MSAISLRLPNSLHKRLREVAMRDEVSINQFIATAIAEKLSALLTAEYLGQRSKRGRRSRYLKVLGKVRSVPPQRTDE